MNKTKKIITYFLSFALFLSVAIYTVAFINVQALSTDYAVSDNGYARAGSPTFADTEDGLLVTFNAAGNRFEVKLGDQSANYAAGKTIQFYMKTTLESITVGGVKFSTGGRTGAIAVDLTKTVSTASYTTVDLGSNLKLVRIPLKSIYESTNITELALRFYDANAAGTFTLSQMTIAEDYAIYANGYARQGSPSFADTEDGLQVTFNAAGNRFEVKLGDQSANYAAGKYVRFQIETTLSSIKVGGVKFSTGGRTGEIQVDLTQTGSETGYSVVDLGNDNKIVYIPLSAVYAETNITELAIRFYDASAAGTFTLSDMGVDGLTKTVTVVSGTGGGSYNFGNSVTVTANVAPSGKKFSQWTNALGETVSEDTSYTFYVSESVTLTANYVDKEQGFAMVAGASVRTSSPNGIKFKATIPADYFDEDATYGMIILPNDYLIENSISDDYIEELTEKSIKFRQFTCTPIESGDDYYIQASLTNIFDANTTRNFIGIAYQYKNGEYIYAESNDNVRSINYVAERAIKDKDYYSSASTAIKEYLSRKAGILGEGEDLSETVVTFLGDESAGKGYAQGNYPFSPCPSTGCGKSGSRQSTVSAGRRPLLSCGTRSPVSSRASCSTSC